MTRFPAALEQLGVAVSLIGSDELSWGDLSKYNVIMTGVRAYERRLDLRAYNQRLLDYAAAGGTVIVNYNKFEFNEAQYAPYPGKVGRERVTDENAEVRLLQPKHPVFNTPNAIGRADWTGWVQERGLYFFDTQDRDPRIQDLSSSRSRSTTTRAPSAARWSRRRSARAAGSTSASASGASCQRAPTAHFGSWPTC